MLDTIATRTLTISMLKSKLLKSTHRRKVSIPWLPTKINAVDSEKELLENRLPRIKARAW